MALEKQNFINLNCVQIPLANRITREIFLIQWMKNSNSNQWNDTIEQGTSFVTGIGKKAWSTSSRRQKLLLQLGNTNLWDFKLCNHVLQKTNFKENGLSESDKTRLSELASIQNMIYKNYKTTVSNNEYKEIKHKIEEVLKYLCFGEIIENFDLQNLPLRQLLIDKSNIFSAKFLKDMANSFYVEQKFNDAIQAYNQALQLTGISVDLLGTLYSNRSAVHLSMAESDNTAAFALEDAKRATQLQPEWFRGYYRLGCAYQMLNKYEKAFKCFSIAAELEKSKMEIICLRNKCEEKIPEPATPHQMAFIQKFYYVNYLNRKFSKFSPFAGMAEYKNMNHDSLFLVWKALQLTNNGDEFRGNDKQVFTLLRKAADLGDNLALYYVAMMYRFGVGVKKDLQKGIELLKSVASLPQAKNQLENISIGNALCDLGIMYERGDGICCDLEEAVKLYKKASQHGNSIAAYNLGVMLVTGRGVIKNEEKAVNYLQLAAKRNNSHSMRSLAHYYLDKEQPLEAFKWHQQAIRNGNKQAISTSQQFEAELRKLKSKLEDPLNRKQQLDYVENNQSNLVETGFEDYFKEIDTFIRQQCFLQSEDVYEYDTKLIDEYAKKGSDIAKGMKKSMSHYSLACKLIKENNKLLAPKIIHELAQSIRSSEFVNVDNECNVALNFFKIFCMIQNVKVKVPSEIDRALRVCIVNNTYRIDFNFLEECVKLYPNDVLFLEFLCVSYGIVKEFQKGLETTEKALIQFPNNYNLWFAKIGYAFQLETLHSKFINVCEKYLELAPSDHPNVPKIIYKMGLSWLQHRSGESKALKYYHMGLEAEKNQLPFLVSVPCPERLFLEKLLMHKEKDDVMMNPINFLQSVDRTSDTYRIETIIAHREMISSLILCTFKTEVNYAPSAFLEDMEPIFLITMNPITNQFYQGRALHCQIIDELLFGLNRIQFIIQDGNKHVERVSILHVTSDDTMHQILGYGCNITILNPYYLMTADGKPMIYVASIGHVIFDAVQNISCCRYCGKIDSFMKCSRCHRVIYCSKKCQLDDWRILKHKLICYVNLL